MTSWKDQLIAMDLLVISFPGEEIPVMAHSNGSSVRLILREPEIATLVSDLRAGWRGVWHLLLKERGRYKNIFYRHGNCRLRRTGSSGTADIQAHRQTDLNDILPRTLSSLIVLSGSTRHYKGITHTSQATCGGILLKAFLACKSPMSKTVCLPCLAWLRLTG